MATGAKAGDAFIQFHGDFTGLNKDVGGALKPLVGKFGKFGTAAAGGLVGVGAGAAVAGKALYDIGSRFDDAYDKIQIRTGATGRSLKGLKADFRDVVKSVPTDFDSASTAVSGLSVRLRLTGEPLRAISKQVLEFSRLTGTDLQSNIPAITRLFGDWSIRTNQQSSTLDRLFRLTQRTGIELPKLATFMTNFGSPLRQLGLDFDTSAAMFARFEREGVNIQTALPGLKMALKNFAQAGRDPARALQATFERIREAGTAARANTLAFRVFGARAGPDMAAAIREGRFSLGELISGMRNGRATIQSTARDTEDLSEKWTIFKNRVLVGLEPLATKVFNGINQAVGRLIDMDPSRLMRRLSHTLNLSRADIREFQQSVTVIIKRASQVFNNVLLPIARRAISGVVQSLRGLATIVRGVVNVIAGVLTLRFGRAWRGVRQIFSGGIQFVIGRMRSATAGVREVAARVGSALSQPMSDAWAKVKRMVSDGVEFVVNKLKDSKNAAAKAALAFAMPMIIAARAIRDAIKWVADAIDKVLSKLGSVKDKIGGIIPNLPDLTPGFNLPFQRGGHIQGGLPTGDSIPALLERDEYVLNRRAVKAVGKGTLDQINFGAVPRFARGGQASGGYLAMVAKANEIDSHHYPYLWGGGHDSGFSPPYDCSGAWSAVLHQAGLLASPLTSGSMMSIGLPGPGLVTLFANPEHVYGSLGGRFWGTSGANPGGGAGWFPGGARAGFSVRHVVGGEGLGDLIPAIGFDGPDGPLKDIAKGSVDMVRKAANAYLTKQIIAASTVPGMPGDGSDLGSVTGNGSGLMKEISKQRGWNFADWWAVDAKETGHGSGSMVNPTSTARLRGQFLDFNYGKYGPGSDPRQNPSMAQQIQAMANYIASRYGNPTSALRHHEAYNWYQQGGLVEMLQRGGRPRGARTRRQSSIGSSLNRTIHALSGKNPKKRAKVLTGLLNRIKGIGLPEGVLGQLKRSEINSTLYGDRADMASQLTMTDADGNEVLGSVGGKNEQGWLSDQLRSLFHWRNTLLRAREAVAKTIKRVLDLIEAAKKRLHDIAEKIIEQGNLRKRLESELEDLKSPRESARDIRNDIESARKRLKDLRRNPKKNKAKIEDTVKRINQLENRLDGVRKGADARRERRRTITEKIAQIAGEQAERMRQRDSLRDRIIPGFEARSTAMRDDSGNYDQNLETVQGAGSIMWPLSSLPAIGALGGSIFNAQLRIRDLGIKPPTSTDSSAEDPIEPTVPDTPDADAPSTPDAPDDSERNSILESLLEQASQRFATSQAELSVFSKFPFAGVFHGGGTVPGPIGSEQLALVQGGERITRADVGGSTIRLIVEDHRIRVVSDDVRTIVQDETRRIARNGTRRITSLAGS